MLLVVTFPPKGKGWLHGYFNNMFEVRNYFLNRGFNILNKPRWVGNHNRLIIALKEFFVHIDRNVETTGRLECLK